MEMIADGTVRIAGTMMLGVVVVVVVPTAAAAAAGGQADQLLSNRPLILNNQYQLPVSNRENKLVLRAVLQIFLIF
jgi:hypothetical protein